MDLTQVLHMKGGVGEESYANNSSLQVLSENFDINAYK
jgi:hypothetical protein